ncbi:alginate lyase family protein [Paenibacillus thiaminolyticus]|uniref:alginate lyase family protein n=1 Tax=Paenibacillus thiaminolyticus TaxID=49283 RepID=UPI0035A5E571
MENKILKTTHINNNTIKIADLILDNQFYLFAGLDVIPFNNRIDWNYQHYKQGSSYQLYLHALYPISFLVNAYEVSKCVKYLEKSLHIIEDWSQFEQSEHRNLMIWYDHPSAHRIQNISYFYISAKDKLKLDHEFFQSLIYRHVDYLNNDDNYTKNNHGIMMDTALIMLGLLFDEAMWVQKGLWRVKDNFISNFSHKGVHLENSIEYHLFVQRMFKELESYLNKNGLTLGEDAKQKILLSYDFYKYMVKPDGNFPMIGDSSKIKNTSEKSFESFFDSQAGIAIIQAEKEKKEESTWISFICGYGNLAHKHFDDLSFTLYSNGDDIFIDSGKYGYERSKLRNYIKSPLSHNTVTVKGEMYDMLKPEESLQQIRITDFCDNSVYSYVKGINFAYHESRITRSLLFFKPDVLIIVDHVKSNANKTTLQNFNLDPSVVIEKVNNKEARLKVRNNMVYLKQHTGADGFHVHTGDRAIPRAVISEKSGELIDTSQIEFVKKGIEVCFVTSICISHKRLKSLKYEKGEMKVKLREGTYNIVI